MAFPRREPVQTVRHPDHELQLDFKPFALELQAVLGLSNVEEAPVPFPLLVARPQQGAVARFLRQAFGLTLLRNELPEKLAGLSNSPANLALRQRKELARLAVSRPLGAESLVEVRLADSDVLVIDLNGVKQREPVRIASCELSDPGLQLPVRPPDLSTAPASRGPGRRSYPPLAWP